MLSQLISFLPVITLMVMIPGANNLLVLRTASESGARAGGAAALGASAGIVAWSSAVALGVGGLVSAVPGGLDTVALAGSLTMVAMGVWALVPRRASSPSLAAGRGFATGLVVCLANPRTPVLAVAVLPQYAVEGAAALSTLALGGAWGAVAALWNLLCIAAARGRFTGDRRHTVQRVGGVVVIGVGVVGLVGL